METICKEAWRITSIIRDSSGYNFFTRDRRTRVYLLLYNEAECWIPEIPSDAFYWQCPVLRVETTVNGIYERTTLNGRVIHTHQADKRTPLEKFIAYFPENPEMEAAINRLPILYRPGLKALNYLLRDDPEARSYLSVLVWLNQLAAKIYARYNSLRILGENCRVRVRNRIERNNLAKEGLLSDKAEQSGEMMSAREHLDLLGVKEFERLPDNDKEVVTALVFYIMRVNEAVAADSGRIYSRYCNENKVYKTEEEMIRSCFIEKRLETYQSQDLLQKRKISPDEMLNFVIKVRF